jgi:4-diphosphocytidyl-2-C-methyl-D-erythritol kinase
MEALRALAPAKINLGLFLGPRRADGRHELATVMQSISLADELTLEAAGHDGADEVICPGVPAQENLAAHALHAFREATGWAPGALRLEISKRIPIAAGLAGGSADAAAALRLAMRASGLGGEELLLELAVALGADVPAQLRPGRTLAGGAGERVTPLPDPHQPLGVLVLALDTELSTGEVFAQADRLGLEREPAAIRTQLRALRAALELGAPLPPAELLENDLERAALALRPRIAAALEEAREAGAEHALVSGSGPTVLGLFARANGEARAARAAAALAGRSPAPLHARSVAEEFGRPQPLAPRGRRGGTSQFPPGAA